MPRVSKTPREPLGTALPAKGITGEKPLHRTTSGGTQEAIRITFFPNQSAQSKTTGTLTLEQLRDKIQTTTAAEKGKLPWLKLAAFGNKRTELNCIRNNDNVVSITGVELDYDDKEMNVDDAIAIAEKAKLRALLYTSASYTDASAEVARRGANVATIATQRAGKAGGTRQWSLGGIFDGASFTLSQSVLLRQRQQQSRHTVSSSPKATISTCVTISTQVQLASAMKLPRQPTKATHGKNMGTADRIRCRHLRKSHMGWNC